MSVYEGMKGKKVKTLAYKVFLLAHEKVSDDAVYQICKAFYDPKNRDFILSMYKPLRDGLDTTGIRNISPGVSEIAWSSWKMEQSAWNRRHAKSV